MINITITFKGIVMGKPIKKSWFGKSTLTGNQIVVNGVKFADGTTATSAYIVKQTGSDAYIVRDSADTHAAEIVFMVNATSVGNLLPGQCFILATPFGGSALPCKKIAQYRVDLFAADGTVDSYTWSTQPATALGQANLIVLGEPPVNTVLPAITGTAQVGQTLSVSTGTWTGAATITYTYAWYENGSTPLGVTTNTLVPGGGLVGDTLTVRVTGTNAVGSSTVITLPVGPVIS